MKYWQHDETGRICESEEKPSDRWYEISKELFMEILPSVIYVDCLDGSEFEALVAEAVRMDAESQRRGRHMTGRYIMAVIIVLIGLSVAGFATWQFLFCGGRGNWNCVYPW